MERIKRIMSHEEASELSLEELLQLRSQGVYAPVGGGETQPDDDDEPDDDPDDDDDGGADDDDEDGEFVRLPRREADALRREVAERRRERERMEREHREAEERQAAEEGRWQDIANDREEQLQEIESERDTLRMELVGRDRRHRVTSIAGRLNLRDPADAYLFLREEEMDDDDRTERALKRIVREKPYLKSDQPSTGGPLGGGNEGGISFEELSKMSPDQINSRWGDVQRSLQEAGDPHGQ